MTASVARIQRYPVKGLSGQSLREIVLEKGQGLPDDRRYALAHGACRFDSNAPDWRPKSEFLVLMKNERLADLASDYDTRTMRLALARGGREVAAGELSTPEGRAAIEEYLLAFLGPECFGAVRVLETPGHMFSDTREKFVSFLNLASVEDFSARLGRPVDPRRFRANIWLAGLEPWQEMEWPGKALRCGATNLAMARPTKRCAATEVNPDSAERDLAVPDELRRLYGHIFCGIYGSVESGGRIAIGDRVTIAPK
jgi:uncharacterized protein